MTGSTDEPEVSPTGAGGEQGTPEVPLPLRELERVLAPIRRVVSFALTPAGAPSVRYLGANLGRIVGQSRVLDLPDPIRERFGALEQALAGLDDLEGDARVARLADVYAHVARIDAITGLPVHLPLRPVPKAQQVDLEERSTVPPSGDSGLSRGHRDDPTEEIDEDDDEDGPPEFAGELGAPLADLGLPDSMLTLLGGAGIYTLRDLLLRRPTWSEAILPVHGAGRAVPEGRVAVGGRIRLVYRVFRPEGGSSVGAILVGAGPLRVEWGDPAPPADRLRDLRAVVAGDHSQGVLRDAEIVASDERGVHLASWGVPDLPDRVLRAAWSIVAEQLSQLRDPHPVDLLRRFELPGLGAALLGAHLTNSDGARRRLAFDEVLVAQLAATLARFSTGRERGISQVPLHSAIARVGVVHELSLYDDAQLHLEEIKRDIRRSAPMRRVLTGEVGGGKGLVALLTAAMVAEGKSQVLILGSSMAEVEQRFVVSEPLLRESGLVARVVSTPPTRAQLDAIKRGEVHVVFGTIDLLEQEVEYRRLGLVVATEREQFGRVGVLHGALPAPRPDLLVTTAVPVGPRLLLTAYADHHVSVLVDPHRRPATIHLCRAEDRAEAYRAVREGVAAGQQALVVFPLVDGADAVDIPEALRVVRALEQDVLSGLRVALLHGAMSREDRVRVYDDLLHRRTDVLVSTTTYEEGPSVSGVCTVVVEQADRVDQIRLHRVIGHMSRAARQADAFLVVGEMADPGAAARIDRVLSAPNGFQLTEALVSLRGIERMVAPGAPPWPQLAWFEPDTDLALLIAAREEVMRIVRADPQLRRGSHAEIGRELAARWNALFPEAARHGWQCPVRDEPAPEPRRRRRRRRRRR